METNKLGAISQVKKSVVLQTSRPKKRVWVPVLVALVLLLNLVLVACSPNDNKVGLPQDPNSGTEQTTPQNPDSGTDQTAPQKLETPMGVRLEEDTLHWQPVDNATKYIIDLDGVLYFVNSPTTSFQLPSGIINKQGRYLLKVMATAGKQEEYEDSEFSNPVEYHTYGTINQSGTREEGAFGAFDDLDKSESYMGYGFDVINSADFNSKTVKITNPLFQKDSLLEQRLVKQHTFYSDVRWVDQNNIETFLKDWNASLSTTVKFPLGSVSIGGKFGTKKETTATQHFMGMDIYNESYYLVLQIEDIQDYWKMLTTGFERDLYSTSISPATLFNRYGTHFITSAVLGGRIHSYYHLQSSEEKDMTELSANIKLQVGKVVSGNVEGSFEYKEEATSKNISINNNITVMGGTGFGMLTDEDIRVNYKAWEQSLNQRPSLIGIKDTNSLYEIWELIDPDRDSQAIYEYTDENDIPRTGTRRDQLAAYFYKYGLDAYNDLMGQYEIVGKEKPREITNIKIDGDSYSSNTIYNLDQDKDRTQITFGVLPENAVGYTKTFTLLEGGENYAILDNQGYLTIKQNTPNNQLVYIQLGAGGITQTIRILLNYYNPISYNVTFSLNGGTWVSPPSQQQVSHGATIHRPIDPIRTGYDFNGWYMDTAFNVLYEFDNPVFSDIALYAKWTPQIVYFTITYYANGGVFSDNSTTFQQTVQQDSTTSKPASPTKTNSLFVEWQTVNGNPFNFDNPITTNTALYAKWIDNANIAINGQLIRSDTWDINDNGYGVDNIYFSDYGTNVANLVALNYTSVTITITLQARASKDMFQIIEIWGGEPTYGNIQLYQNITVPPNSSWTTISFSYTETNLSQFSTHNRFWIRYNAFGVLVDATWQNKDVNLSYQFN